jgi:hypothetical protein
MRSDSKNALLPAQHQPRVVRQRSTTERERLLTLFARSGQILTQVRATSSYMPEAKADRRADHSADHAHH